LRHALFAARITWSGNFASTIFAAFTARRSSTAA